MESGKAKSRTDVCLLAPHSAALREMRHALSPEKYTVQTKVLTVASARVEDAVPAAHIYVIDIEGSLAQVAPAVSDIIHSRPSSLFIATAETFREVNTFPMLRLGIKGIVEHALLETQLEHAIETVAAGGYWVPRVILSEFVSSILKTSPRPRLERAEVDLSRREVEIMEALMDNLANKEIGSRLGISERTVKFHVSNVLRKFHVRRRADLILLGLQSTVHGETG